MCMFSFEPLFHVNGALVFEGVRDPFSMSLLGFEVWD